jgi:hypothetical protein
LHPVCSMWSSVSFTRQWDLTFVERTEPSSCAISP